MNTDAVLRIVSIANLRLMAVIDRLNANLCLGFWSVEGVGALPDFDTDAAVITDITGIASEAICRKLTVNQETYLVNGWDANKIISGTTIREAGADAAPAPVLGIGAATGLTGSYTAVYTYYDSTRDFETSPVETAPSLITLANQSLSVAVVASTNSRFDKIRIYRNANDVPATYLLDLEVQNNTASFNLSRADADLGAEVLYTNYRFPPVKYVAKTATRVFCGGTRPFTQGTASVSFGSTSITLSVAPPPNMYTRNAEAPFYFQRTGGPRYGITAINGNVITISVAYAGISETGVAYQITGLPTRIYYSDISTTGLVKAESFNPSNKFDLGLNADTVTGDYQEVITAIIEYSNRLYAFMRGSIWYFDPLLTQRKRTQARTGTLSDKTIKQDRDGHYLFMGSDMQVYAFAGTSTTLVSGEVHNLFAKKDRYNMNLMEYAYARYDSKEGLYYLYRPTAAATLSAMRYVVDIYDDFTGKWHEAIPPRVTAVTEIRDESRYLTLGIDTLGLVHQMDDYENSTTLGDDKFAVTTPTVLTSVAGEISPGANKRGKLAIIFTDTAVKGSKLIIGTQTTSVPTEDLIDAVTVAAGDSYLIGGWHGKYETGWIDLGEPDMFKVLHFIDGTFIQGSAGYLYITIYLDQSSTAHGTIRIDAALEPHFKRTFQARGRQIKMVLEFVTELVGCGLREINLNYKMVSDV